MSENCRESCGFCSNSVKGYCHIPYHTMCLYKGLSESCAKNLVYRGISDQAKKDIVDAHNEVRSRIALGKVKGQPPASDMNKLEWNDELSRIAQRLADQCKDEHDRLRNKLDGTQVGQNIYTKPYTAAMSQAVVEAKIKDGVMNWFGEEKKPGFNPKNIQPFKFEKGNGHYTQTVWAKTTQVGCGAVHFAEPNGNFPYYYLLVCNYAVAGNYLSAKQMYKQGAACSACMPGREGCENGLCTKKK